MNRINIPCKFITVWSLSYSSLRLSPLLDYLSSSLSHASHIIQRPLSSFDPMILIPFYPLTFLDLWSLDLFRPRHPTTSYPSSQTTNLTLKSLAAVVEDTFNILPLIVCRRCGRRIRLLSLLPLSIQPLFAAFDKFGGGLVRDFLGNFAKIHDKAKYMNILVIFLPR